MPEPLGPEPLRPATPRADVGTPRRLTPAKTGAKIEATPTSRRQPASPIFRLFTGATSATLGWICLSNLGIEPKIPHGWDDFLPLAIAAIGALWGLGRLRWILHTLAALALAGWFYVGLAPQPATLARTLVEEQTPQAADAVLVLASNVQPDGDFTDAALERLMHGLELVGQKYAPRLILTEVPPPSGSYATAARRLAKNLALDCPIEAVGPVGNTHDEAVLVSRLARQHGWKRILLVTSPVHSRRAALTLRKTGLEIISTPCRETRYDLENPSTPDQRRRAFDAALHEIIGLRAYRWRGWA